MLAYSAMVALNFISCGISYWLSTKILGGPLLEVAFGSGRDSQAEPRSLEDEEKGFDISFNERMGGKTIPVPPPAPTASATTTSTTTANPPKPHVQNDHPRVAALMTIDFISSMFLLSIMHVIWVLLSQNPKYEFGIDVMSALIVSTKRKRTLYYACRHSQ